MECNRADNWPEVFLFWVVACALATWVLSRFGKVPKYSAHGVALLLAHWVIFNLIHDIRLVLTDFIGPP